MTTNADMIAEWLASPRKAPSPEEISAWWDATMDASAWWQTESVSPLHAAMLLCRFNPNRETPEQADANTTDETGPEDFRRLLNVFMGAESSKPLAAWIEYAEKRGLKTHSWIRQWRASSATEQVKRETQDGGVGTNHATLIARYKELIATNCKNPTATVAKEFGISDSRVRAIKRKVKAKPASGMGAMTQQLTKLTAHKIGK